VALIDMTISPVFAGGVTPPLPEYEAYFVFYKSKLHAMICRGEADRIELFALMFRGWESGLRKAKSVLARPDIAHGRCQNDRAF
jgi:hypothetical protein